MNEQLYDEFKIIKTEGTKLSVGAFMILDKRDNEIFDNEGNNAWDTFEQVKKVIEDIKHDTKGDRK